VSLRLPRRDPSDRRHGVKINRASGATDEERERTPSDFPSRGRRRGKVMKRRLGAEVARGDRGFSRRKREKATGAASKSGLQRQVLSRRGHAGVGQHRAGQGQERQRFQTMLSVTDAYPMRPGSTCNVKW